MEPVLRRLIRWAGWYTVNRPGTANDEDYFISSDSGSFSESCSLAEAGIDIEDDGYIVVVYSVSHAGGLYHTQPNSYLSGSGYMTWGLGYQVVEIDEP